MSLAQLSRMLPLPEADLQQILDYASSLSKQDAADHFNNLLGESPQSIEFISTFNSRRQDQKHALSATESSTSEVPKSVRKQPKKKARLHTPPPAKFKTPTLLKVMHIRSRMKKTISQRSRRTVLPCIANRLSPSRPNHAPRRLQLVISYQT